MSRRDRMPMSDAFLIATASEGCACEREDGAEPHDSETSCEEAGCEGCSPHFAQEAINAREDVAALRQQLQSARNVLLNHGHATCKLEAAAALAVLEATK